MLSFFDGATCARVGMRWPYTILLLIDYLYSRSVGERCREASQHIIERKEMEQLDLSQACQLICSTTNSGDDDMAAYSWIGVALFLVSELLTYVDVQPNGIIQVVAGILKVAKNRIY